MRNSPSLGNRNLLKLFFRGSLGDTTFIPVPEAVAKTFIPSDTAIKRFEVRCDLLYPEVAIAQSDSE